MLVYNFDIGIRNVSSLGSEFAGFELVTSIVGKWGGGSCPHRVMMGMMIFTLIQVGRGLV